MLSKLAYLTLCRSIQLLVLLARGDATKDWSSSSSNISWPSCGGRPTSQAGAR